MMTPLLVKRTPGLIKVASLALAPVRMMLLRLMIE